MITALVSLLVLISLGLIVTVPVALATPGEWESSKGTFNPVVRGSKVWAVFGFCDIRNFTDCCEVLEEETMIFTNEIAFVVHGRVHSSGNIPFIHIHC